MKGTQEDGGIRVQGRMIGALPCGTCGIRRVFSAASFARGFGTCGCRAGIRRWLLALSSRATIAWLIAKPASFLIATRSFT